MSGETFAAPKPEKCPNGYPLHKVIFDGVCYECLGEEAARRARLEEKGIFLGR